jgi:hypothetical protein
MIALLIAQVTMQTLAPGIPNAVPPTRFSCELTAADGSRFTVGGTTPLFPKGWDPNRANYVELQSSHAEAFRRKVGIDPGEAGDWFRDFQVSSGYPGVAQYTLQLKLRKEGASVGYVTRYLSTGQRIPFEYYAAGLCKADFAPAAGAGQERGQP